MMTQKTKIIWIICGSITALVVLVIILVVVMRPVPERDIQSEQQVAALVAYEKVSGLANKVFTGADTSTCLEASDQATQDQCFSLVASGTSDEGLCNRIADASLRDQCLLEFAIVALGDGADPKMCLEFIEETTRKSCLVVAIDEGAGLDFCNLFSGDDNVYCLDRFQLVKGLAGDADACLAMSDEDMREECSNAALHQYTELPPLPPRVDTDDDGLFDDEEEELGTDPDSADTDSDGLSDFDEVNTHGTDPLQSDTDGDGFDDATEISGGYDPTGPGRL